MPELLFVNEVYIKTSNPAPTLTPTPTPNPNPNPDPDLDPTPTPTPTPNEVYIKTSPPSCFEINEPNVTKGGTLVKRCGLSFEEVCRYKYMLNVGSNGYANKLKYLFLCGSVVIWVRKDSLNHEFFERHLVPGVH